MYRSFLYYANIRGGYPARWRLQHIPTGDPGHVPPGKNDKTGPENREPETGNAGNPYKTYVFSKTGPAVIIR